MENLLYCVLLLVSSLEAVHVDSLITVLAFAGAATTRFRSLRFYDGQRREERCGWTSQKELLSLRAVRQLLPHPGKRRDNMQRMRARKDRSNSERKHGAEARAELESEKVHVHTGVPKLLTVDCGDTVRRVWGRGGKSEGPRAKTVPSLPRVDQPADV